jgi:hypothetical protein
MLPSAGSYVKIQKIMEFPGNLKEEIGILLLPEVLTELFTWQEKTSHPEDGPKEKGQDQEQPC